jgi:hypothetical protein
VTCENASVNSKPRHVPDAAQYAAQYATPALAFIRLASLLLRVWPFATRFTLGILRAQSDWIGDLGALPSKHQWTFSPKCIPCSPDTHCQQELSFHVARLSGHSLQSIIIVVELLRRFTGRRRMSSSSSDIVITSA